MPRGRCRRARRSVEPRGPGHPDAALRVRGARRGGSGRAGGGRPRRRLHLDAARAGARFRAGPAAPAGGGGCSRRLSRGAPVAVPEAAADAAPEGPLPAWASALGVFDLETTGIDAETARIVTAHVGLIDATGDSSRTDWIADPGVEIPRAPRPCTASRPSAPGSAGRPARSSPRSSPRSAASSSRGSRS